MTATRAVAILNVPRGTELVGDGWGHREHRGLPSLELLQDYGFEDRGERETAHYSVSRNDSIPSWL